MFFILVTAILWFVYSVPELYREFSGRKMRKNIRELFFRKGERISEEKSKDEKGKKKQNIRITREIILVHDNFKGDGKRDEKNDKK